MKTITKRFIGIYAVRFESYDEEAQDLYGHHCINPMMLLEDFDSGAIDKGNYDDLPVYRNPQDLEGGCAIEYCCNSWDFHTLDDIRYQDISKKDTETLLSLKKGDVVTFDLTVTYYGRYEYYYGDYSYNYYIDNLNISNVEKYNDKYAADEILSIIEDYKNS